MNYLFYDSSCWICRFCAFVVDKMFVRTIPIGSNSKHNSHYWFGRIFPNAILRLETDEVGLYIPAEDRFVYGEDAIRYMCTMDGRSFKIWNMLYKMANFFRNKCKQCRLGNDK